MPTTLQTVEKSVSKFKPWFRFRSCSAKETKLLATVHSKGRVKDVVITVPAYFGQAERKGLIQAAELAGINVLSLVNEHSGAALQYGIDKDFSNGSRNVVFYDMGASSTYAALVHFSAYNAKEYGKSVSVNQFQVLLKLRPRLLSLTVI